MTRRHVAKSHALPFVGIGACLVLAAAFSGCSSRTSGRDASPAAAPSIPTPLATSVQSPDGTWATVPMGYLDQPLNTFWQLFFEPAGTDRWSNLVEATAVATNGGIVLASAQDGPLLVGVRPSNDLEYSPLILSTDAGRSWSNGVLAKGLSAHPDALAVESPDQALGLVTAAGRAEVLRSEGGLTSWQTYTDEQELASSVAGRACGLRTITAVSYLEGAPAVGAACDRAGVVGIFARRAGDWQLVGPTLRSGLAAERVEVLGLSSTGAGLSALLGLSGRAGASLVATWTSGDEQWTSSAPLSISASDRLSSFGPATGSGLYVLLGASTGKEHLAVVGPDTAWQQLPTPPGRTETVAFGADATIDALSVNRSVLRVWTLSAASSWWSRGQVIDVPIQYGSSS